MPQTVYQVEECLDPALQMLGWGQWRRADRKVLPAHEHGEAFEVCCIERGLAHWWVEGEVYELGPGQLFLTRPGEVHGSLNSGGEVLSLRWAIFNPSPIRDRSWTMVLSAFRRLKGRVAEDDGQTLAILESLLGEHKRRDDYAPANVRGLLGSLMVAIIRAERDSKTAFTNRPSKEIARVITWLHGHTSDPWKVADLATMVNMGTTIFHERFRKETGHTPNDYGNRLRILKARERLRDAKTSVTAVAFDLGFPSSQYFATVFKRFTGMTPRQWRSRNSL